MGEKKVQQQNIAASDESDVSAKNTTENAIITESDKSQSDVSADNGSQAVQTEQPALPPTVVELKKRRWLPYVITVGVLAALTLLCAWPFNGYTASDVKDLVGDWSSAFSVPGIVCMGVGLLIWCGNEGAFDMLSYGVQSLFRLFRKDVRDRKYGGYYEYQQARKNKKKPFLYMVIVGGAYTLVGVVLIIIYTQL